MISRSVIQTPKWATEVFDSDSQYDIPIRYRVAYGGRGSTKSWEFARRALRLAMRKKIRFLCGRELQVSIKDSVHKLLVDQIELLGLQGNFRWTDKKIISITGSEFIFKGIRHNTQEIKSTEGIDICWIEEAHSVSKESWEVLDPTVRKPNSEVWLTFNPDLETDPMYKEFVVNPPANAIVRKVNSDENPWFPDVLRVQRERLKEVDYIAYLHVWNGEPRSNSDAQILFGKWRVESFEPDDDWGAPYFGADWGFSQDPTTLIKHWIHNEILYIEYEAYGVKVDIDKTPKMFDKIPDARKYVIYADNARPETISYMNRNGYPKIKACAKWKGCVEDGIAHVRQYREIVVHPRCTNYIDECRLYSYKIDSKTNDILPQIVDKHNHCIDATRYALGKLIRKRQSKQSRIIGLT